MAIRLQAKLVYERWRVARLLRRLRPAALILFDDRVPFPEMTLLHCAQRIGTPCVLVPYGVSSPDADAFLRRDSAEYYVTRAPWRWLKRWIAQRYPALVRETSYGPMLFYKPWDTLALSATGLIEQQQPWTWGGGRSEKVIAFGPRGRDELIAAGVEPEKIIAAGQASLDELFRLASRQAEIRRALQDRYGLSPEKTVLACTVPHLAEHDISSWEQHWEDTRRLLEGLGSSGAHVVVSLHPRSDPELYRGLISELGLYLLAEPLMQVLPAVDGFIAHFSSTVRWALLLGIPCIIIDQVGFNYSIYDGIGGIVFLQGDGDLKETAHRMATDTDWRARLARDAAQYGQQHELFDGQAGRRIVAVLAALIEKQPQQ